MLEENRRIQRTSTIVKFIVDTSRPHSRNHLITRTLGKIGVISADYNGTAPNNEEFWLVGFRKEVTKSQGNPCSGLFILEPLRYIDRTQISYLSPGLYSIEDECGIRYVIPKFKNSFWLMSIPDRRRLVEQSNSHSVVVVNYDINPDGQMVETHVNLGGINHYTPPVTEDGTPTSETIADLSFGG